jgi:hypothetical protein
MSDTEAAAAEPKVEEKKVAPSTAEADLTKYKVRFSNFQQPDWRWTDQIFNIGCYRLLPISYTR